MAIYLYRGEPTVRYYAKTASTALSVNGFVSLSSGQLIKATTSTTVNPGVCLREVASTDADYALTTKVPVLMNPADCELIIDVITGTATAALVGTTVDIASGGMGVDVGTDTHHQVTVTGFISATKILGRLNDNVSYKQAS